MSSSCTILGRWKIGRLNILNGMTWQRNGFTYAEARIRLSKSGTQAAREKAGLLKRLTIAGIREAVEVGRDYLELETLRRNLDWFGHLSPKDTRPVWMSTTKPRKIRSPVDNDEFTLKSVDASHGERLRWRCRPSVSALELLGVPSPLARIVTRIEKPIGQSP